jgi:hypothetical protein
VEVTSDDPKMGRDSQGSTCIYDLAYLYSILCFLSSFIVLFYAFLVHICSIYAFLVHLLSCYYFIYVLLLNIVIYRFIYILYALVNIIL